MTVYPSSQIQALKVICKDHQDKVAPTSNQTRSSNSISADVDRLLSPKSLKELEALEKQISSKLQSDEPIDIEYWEKLLGSVSVYKSRAELSSVYDTIIRSRLSDLRHEQSAEAFKAKEKLSILLNDSKRPDRPVHPPQYATRFDPEPLLKTCSEDKSLDLVDERSFVNKNVGLQDSDPIVMSFPDMRKGHRTTTSDEIEIHTHTNGIFR